MDNFVHLHNHSSFSLLDGIIQPKDLAKKAKQLQQQAVALTDHGTIAGIIKFYRACMEENIKPIIGCEIYIDFTDEFDWIKKPNHLTVICKNNIGFTNLIKMHNYSTLEKGYKRIRVTFNELCRFKEGLIILSGCPNSIINKLIDNDKDPEEMIQRFQNHFEDDFYIELMYHGLDIEKKLLPRLRDYAGKFGIKKVATNDSHYLNKEDSEPQYIATLDAMKKNINDSETMKKFPDEFYLKTREQMGNFYEDELNNTLEIANKCNINMEKFIDALPKTDRDIDEFLICGLDKLPKAYLDRYESEKQIIKEANLENYFGVVCDFLDFAKKSKILVGPGRGSVGGSLYAFMHGIHKVNPIKYGLFFSRFYNHGRKGGMPDIDMDFCKEGIGNMYQYLQNKYGTNNVVHIGISGKAGVKGALKMVCRTLGIDFQTSNNYSKMVPEKPENIFDILQNPEAKNLYNTDPLFKKAIDITGKTEGINFSFGIHASGIIISKYDLTDKLPLRKEDGTLLSISYWDMEDIEYLGFMKFDFLTIDTLDVIKKTLEMIGKDNYDYIIKNFDPTVFKFIQEDSHVGLFQITSSGISKLVRDMKPDNIIEISHLVALYRPGPLTSGFHNAYVNRKFGLEEVKYEHPLLEPILNKNFGLCISGDSDILTDKYSSLKIKDVNIGDKIIGCELESCIVTNKFNNGIKETIKIITSDGREIECTADHRIRTFDGWVKAEDTIGKLIPRLFNYRKNGNIVDTYLLKVIGYLIGDGSISSKSNIQFTNADKAILNDFEFIVNKIGDKTKRYYNKSNTVTKIAVYHNSKRNPKTHSNLIQITRDLGLQGKNSRTKFIPNQILESDRNSVTQFIASYWDCDGHVGEKSCFLKTVSPILSAQVSELLFSIGIANTVTQHKDLSYQISVFDSEAFEPIRKLMLKNTTYKQSGRCKYRNGFGMGVFPGSYIKSILRENKISQRKISKLLETYRTPIKHNIKRYRANDILNFFGINHFNNYAYYPVVKIIKNGKKPVYDITVDSINHGFVANGIPVHNCIYQEDVIKICIELGGFSETDADVIRKIIGKKKSRETELIQKMKEKFINGALSKGIPINIVEEIWGQMEAHSGYSFNMCLTGDTLVTRANKNHLEPREISVEKIYQRFNEKSHVGKKYRCGKLTIFGVKETMNGLRFDLPNTKPVRVSNVIKNGIQDVYEIITESGKRIKATHNHRFWVENPMGMGIFWEEVKNIKPGYIICSCDFLYEQNKKTWRTSVGDRKTNPSYDGKGFPYGEKNPGYIDGAHIEYEENKAIKLLSNSCELCQIIPKRIEIHHIDHNRNNNSLDNLMRLCVSCHKKEHYKNGRTKINEKGYPTHFEKILSVNYIGKEETYDIEINDETHAFFANGLLSHNSHSVEYGYITYITAYLKKYYPSEFLASCLTMSKNEIEVAKYLNECKRLGIKIHLPNIKNSKEEFVVKNGEIYFSLNSIKNTGDTFLKKILSWQQKAEQTLENFVLFIQPNKRILESLIRSGSMDCFISQGMTIPEHRGKLLHNLVNTNQIAAMQYTGDLFGDTQNNLWKPLEELEMMYDERKYLGTFITSNPLDRYKEQIEKSYYQVDLNEIPPFKINIIGIIDNVTIKYDKNSKEMAIVKILQYNNVPINVVFWNSIWKEISNKVKEGKIMGVSGKIRDAGNFITEQLIMVVD